MTKLTLITSFCSNHQALIDYINALSPGQFIYSRDGKWTAGQQLSHIYLCLKPIAQVLASKEFIEQQFGKIDRAVMEYDEVIDTYKRALEKGGVAPSRFLPEPVDVDARSRLVEKVYELLHTIQKEWENYSNAELNSLVLPHPLLGNLTIREMFYLMAYHATHHQRQIEQNLAQQFVVK